MSPALAITPATGDVKALPGRYVVTLSSARPDLAAFVDSLQLRWSFAKGRQWKRLGQFEVALASAQAVAALRETPGVLAVEEPDKYEVLAQQTLGGTGEWGLDVLDQRTLSLNNAFNYYFTGGSGVHIYLVDTGLDCGHNEFALATCSTSTFLANSGWPGPGIDAVGHGTRMASLAAGSFVGIAKTATLHSVKIGNSATGIDEGDITDGLEWVLANAPAAAVVNMSLTPEDGTLSTSFKNAVSNLAAANISVVLGAGNGGPDNIGDNTQSLGFCDLHSAVLVVSAVDGAGHRPSTANFGPCIDLFAPGSGLRAALAGTTGNYVTNSGGTSSATALVTGIVATILQQRPTAGVGEIHDQVLGSATAGILVTIGTGSPNLLANSLHLFYPSVSGPSAITVSSTPVQATWTVVPTGGSGTYSYEWQASQNGGPWTVVSTSASYVRTIPRFSEFTLELKATVASAGDSYTKPYNHTVTVSCGGC